MDVALGGTAVVLGGGGFLGTHLTNHLVMSGMEVVRVIRGDLWHSLRSANGAKVVLGDVMTLDLESLFEESAASVVFHLATPASVPGSLRDPVGDFEGQVHTTLRVLEAIRRAGSGGTRLVFASSAAVYGSSRDAQHEDAATAPRSPYGVAKLAAEGYLRLYYETYGVRTVAARLFPLYGPGQRKQVVFDLLVRLLRGERPLRIASAPEVTRDFVFVDDAVCALMRLAGAAAGEGEPVNIATGCGVSLDNLVGDLCAVSGVRRETIVFSGATRQGDTLSLIGDTSRARALGIVCDTPRLEGLRRTVRWLRSNIRQSTT